MYNERKILPLITQIKTIFEQEIVDFAVLDAKGIRYHYAEMLIANSFTMFEAAQHVKEQQLKYYFTTIENQETVVFHNLDNAYLVVVLEEPLHAKLNLDTLHQKVMNSLFFKTHLDITTTKEHEHEYAMIVADHSGRVRVMNNFAKNIFQANLEKIEDFDGLIKDYRAFYTAYTHVLKSKLSTSFIIDTNQNQRLQTHIVVDKESQLTQFVFTHQPVNSFYNHILDGFDYLRLGVVHFGFMEDEKGEYVDGRVLYANKRYGNMMEENITAMIGRTIYEIYPNYPEARFARYAKVAKTGNRNAFEDYNKRLDKHFYVYTYSPKKGEIINVYYETTHYHHMKHTERLQLKKIQMMLSLAEMGFFEIDVEKKIFSGDQLVDEIFGASEMDYEMYKERFKSQIDDAYKAEIYEKNYRLMQGEITEGSSTVKMYRHSDQKELFVEYYLQTLESYADGKPKKILGLIRDVTESELQHQKIMHLANHDALTGLYNRRNLAKKLKDEDFENPTVLAVFDLDGLKPVNDIFGHYVGDEVLSSFANILKETYPKAYLARVGGDEFLGIMPNDIEAIEDFEMILRDKMRHLLKFHIPLSVSVGYSSWDQSTTFKEAFIDAEESMYRNKLKERPQRKSKTLELIISYLQDHEPYLSAKVKRLIQLAHQFMKDLKYVRSEDLRVMIHVCKYHAIGRISRYIDNPTKDKPFDINNLHEYLHVDLGYKVLSTLLDNDKVSRTVFHQCERFDGTGEPQHLEGDEIPYLSRIFAIVFRFDQLTQDEALDKRLAPNEALKKISAEAGTYFDPQLVERFINMLS